MTKQFDKVLHFMANGTALIPHNGALDGSTMADGNSRAKSTKSLNIVEQTVLGLLFPKEDHCEAWPRRSDSFHHKWALGCRPGWVSIDFGLDDSDGTQIGTDA